MRENGVIVIGGGLAGCEASWQLAKRGVPVRLVEMRPEKTTGAHRTGLLAELVCSNSLKSDRPPTAHALLKEELKRLGSLLLETAERTRVPAGTALAVDRDRFAREVTGRIDGEPLIRIERTEAISLPEEGPVIVATGPLTSEAMAAALLRLVGENRLFFHDAIAPVLSAESLDRERLFAASRYGKGGEDYWNIPLDPEEYERFVDAILAADLHPLHACEENPFFDACLPIEEIARRGREALRFGPFKPVGLVDPATGRRPWAAIQLRRENKGGTAWNLVGCQTRMKQGEQRRIFRTLPGLARAEFLRYGSLHRNTYLRAPVILEGGIRLRAEPRIRLAGQITGVEGYVESIASGLAAGMDAAREARGGPLVTWPRETAIGSLLHYLSVSDGSGFQPTNVHFGLFPPLASAPRGRRGKKERNEAMTERARRALERVLSAEEGESGSPPSSNSL
ncbi:MAG: methylenetetrahydrofolate--tRNA-(uracil(54)-C(5))-methyltransferase (FADH(2)-oxidizing) TrmFO [Candidatus Eisenbacteria bacterium]|nr:methylenetetrahydrofolate--tRNA-(uracil(54)-C(5))-methyltransferase (FADH(2)-oxidizing) TrmFO [Candidatus Eisenbacteria bacterium]